MNTSNKNGKFIFKEILKIVGIVAINIIIAEKKLHSQLFLIIAKMKNEIIIKSSKEIISFIYQYLFFTK